jgi:hypothetical protein
MTFENSESFSENPVLALLKQKLSANSDHPDIPAEEITLTATEAQDLIKQLETADVKIEWLTRKKSTIADLAGAYHKWSRAKIDLSNSRLNHVEQVLDESETVYDSLVEDTPFNRGYRAALYWFRKEIREDPGFDREVKATDGKNS